MADTLKFTPSITDFPFQVGVVCYRTLNEARSKAQYASEVTPIAHVSVIERSTRRVLATFVGGAERFAGKQV